MIVARIGDNQQTRLHELGLDLIGEGTGGESSGNVLSTSVVSVLEHSALSVGTSGDDADISGVLDGDNSAGSEDQLFPGLGDVEEVDSVGSALPHVSVHVEVQVLGAEVGVGSQKLDPISVGGAKGSGERGETGSRHSLD